MLLCTSLRGAVGTSRNRGGAASKMTSKLTNLGSKLGKSSPCFDRTKRSMAGSLHATLSVVELPCFFPPSETAARISMFGGAAALEDARTGRRPNLELKCRPEDPQCRPIPASVSTTPRLVLRLSASSTGTIGTEVIGRVGPYYEFSSLADYQFLRERGPTLGLEGGHVGFDIIPPAFSTVTTHVHNRKHSQSENSLAQFRFTEKKSDFLRSMMKQRLLSDNANDSSRVWKRSRGGLDLSVLRKKLERLFQQRPVWSKDAMLVHLSEAEGTYSRLNRLLVEIAEHVHLGPWTNCWVRLHYDWKSTRESAKFQTVLFKQPRDMEVSSTEKFHGYTTKSQIAFQYVDLCERCPEICALFDAEKQRVLCCEKLGWFRKAFADDVREILLKQFREEFAECVRDESKKSYQNRTYIPTQKRARSTPAAEPTKVGQAPLPMVAVDAFELLGGGDTTTSGSDDEI